jgi:spore coat polysaccharide biosynthesis predicted glycosyltransferase SpsG
MELTRRGEEVVFFCRENAFARETLSSIPMVGVPVLPPEKEALFLSEAARRCRILLTDSYLLTDRAIHMLNQPGRLLVCMDDDALYTYSCDIVVNPHPFAEKLLIRAGRKKPKFWLGGEYWALRDEFEDTAPVVIHPSARRVLCLMGGADVNGYLPAALRALAGTDARITAVLGPMTRNDDEVYRVAEGLPNVEVVKNPPSLAALMRETDIAITSGGNTVYELCVMGVPAVVIPQSDNERIKAKFLSEDETVLYPGDFNEVSGDLLRDCAAGLLENFDQRKRMSGQAARVISRNGKEHLAQSLLDAAYSTGSRGEP